jgi:hypothetical protein
MCKSSISMERMRDIVGKQFIDKTMSDINLNIIKQIEH